MFIKKNRVQFVPKKGKESEQVSPSDTPNLKVKSSAPARQKAKGAGGFVVKLLLQVHQPEGNHIPLFSRSQRKNHE